MNTTTSKVTCNDNINSLDNYFFPRFTNKVRKENFPKYKEDYCEISSSFSINFGNLSLIEEIPNYENTIRCISSTITHDNIRNILNKKYRENRNQLDLISKLDNNWDKYGAEKFNEKILEKAYRIIRNVDIQPELFASSRSTIQLEYDNNDDYLEFEIFKDEIVMYREKGLSSTEEEIEEENISDIVDHFFE